ncbi:hypothetical protein SY91_06359 [Burkholderia cenocepacia]|nr:hypothetical protein SY91_06359 [Burkholderia cenocepacia]
MPRSDFYDEPLKPHSPMQHVTTTSRPPILAAPVDAMLHAVIDEVVHRSVSEATTRGGYMRCADYAIVGARVLTLLTGKPYRPFAGGEVMDFGGGNLYALCTTRERRRTARHLSQLARYHCWIEARHDDALGRTRKEIVDFTLRHDETVANQLGMPFARAYQAYFWGGKMSTRYRPSCTIIRYSRSRGPCGAGPSANARRCCVRTSTNGPAISGVRCRVRSIGSLIVSKVSADLCLLQGQPRAGYP